MFNRTTGRPVKDVKATNHVPLHKPILGSTSSPATSSSSHPTVPPAEKTHKSNAFSLRTLFSKGKSPSGTPPSLPDRSEMTGYSPNTPPNDSLLSKRVLIDLEEGESMKTARTQAIYDGSITVIQSLQTVASMTQLVLPNPVKDILESLIGVVRVLKVGASFQEC